GTFELSLARNSIFSGDTKKAQIFSSGAQTWLQESERGFLRLGSVSLLKSRSRSLAQKAHIFSQVAQVLNDTGIALAAGQSLLKGVVQEDSYLSKNDASTLSLQLKTIEQELAFIQAEIG